MTPLASCLVAAAKQAIDTKTRMDTFDADAISREAGFGQPNA